MKAETGRHGGRIKGGLQKEEEVRKKGEAG